MGILFDTSSRPMRTTLGGLLMGEGAAAVPAPTFSTPPSLGGDIFTIGDTIYLNMGVAGPSASLTIEEFSLDGADKRGELVGNAWDSSGEPQGTLVFRVRATNETDTVVATATAALLSAPTNFNTSRLVGPVSTIAVRGVTFTFSAPIYWYATANGNPVVFSQPAYMGSGGVNITSISPASVQVSTKWSNGAEIGIPANPDGNPGNQTNPAWKQGFDQRIQDSSNPPGVLYDHTLNKDPGATGSPIHIAQNSVFAVIKTISGTAAKNGRWIDRYVILTVMNTLPPSDGVWFMPTLAGTTKAWEHKRETVAARLNCLRSLTRPSGVPTTASVLATMTSQQLHTRPVWYMTSESAGTMQVLGEAREYSAIYGDDRALELLSLHAADGSDADKLELACILVQHGLELIGNYRKLGMVKGRGAGQWYGYIYYPYYAGFLLGDQTILTDCHQIRSNEINQIGWVTQNQVGMPGWIAVWSQARHQIQGTYYDEDVGIPEWHHAGYVPGDTEMPFEELSNGNYKGGSSLTNIYRNFSWDNQPMATLAIALLQNGPGGQTGDQAIIGVGQPADATNIRAASLFYADRAVTWEDYYATGQSGSNGTTKTIWNAWRQYVPTPRWQGRPDIPNDQRSTSQSFGRDPDLHTIGQAAGVVAINLGARNFSTSPVTARRLQYSLDNIHFLPETPLSIPATGTISGLRPGCQHYLRWSQRNDYGWSRWSNSWPSEVKSNANITEFHNFVVTTGSSGAAPSFTVNPRLHYRPHPGWSNSPPYSSAVTLVPTIRQDAYYYKPLTAWSNFSGADRTLYAGCGYISGGGTPSSITYQWHRNTGAGWAAISGAISVNYNAAGESSGTQLRCLVTINTASGSASEYTNSITVP